MLLCACVIALLYVVVLLPHICAVSLCVVGFLAPPLLRAESLQANNNTTKKMARVKETARAKKGLGSKKSKAPKAAGATTGV